MEARPILLLAFRPLDERLEEQSLVGKKGGEKMRLRFLGRKEALVVAEAEATVRTREERINQLTSIITISAMGSLPDDQMADALREQFTNEEAVQALLGGIKVQRDSLSRSIEERRKRIGEIVEGVVDKTMS